MNEPQISAEDARRPKKKKVKKDRIWELDFLRGISIILMCFDHFFFDVYYLFVDWSKSKPFFAGLYKFTKFYFGYASNSVHIAEDKMHFAEYVFLAFILLAVVISLIVKRIKGKAPLDAPSLKNGLSAVGSVSLCLVALLVINLAVGYQVVEGDSLREFIHAIILWIFFILCGEGCYFSKSNVKRFLVIGACAAGISLFTVLGEKWLGIEGIAVRFGVMHMLAAAVLIFTVIQLVCSAIFKDEEKRKYAISITCFVVGTVVYFLNQYLWTIDVNTTDALAWFHYAFAEDFTSSDWFVLSEHLHKVLYGAAVAPFVYAEKKSYIPCLSPLNKGVVCFLGRKTLWIVIFHQGVIYLTLTLLNFLA